MNQLVNIAGTSGFPRTCIQYFMFNPHEIAAINLLVDELAAEFNSIETPQFAKMCEDIAIRLPPRVVELLRGLSSGTHRIGAVIFKGYPLDDERIGDSPRHWDAPWAGTACLREEIFQCLISSGVGSLFGWNTQENGRYLRHIVPIKKDEDEQLGGSSKTPLIWHTEEAFHPARADFFTLMCYRNSEGAATTVVSVDDIDLPEHTKAILAQERFVIEPDKSHFPVNNDSKQWRLEQEAFKHIYAMLEKPVPCAVLFGPTHARMFRVDQAFMTTVDDDTVAQTALDELHLEMNCKAKSIVMTPGDIMLLDNMTVAHGRSVYMPNYGPKQRWMRRINISIAHRNKAIYQDPSNIRRMI
ncbi:TauD/TfdA family dioxygenase [Verminephrobacter aporrectodeae]|nr:TauD/TfdA family dioxygenase [Verminephrobacter aporrectodeae]